MAWTNWETTLPFDKNPRVKGKRESRPRKEIHEKIGKGETAVNK